MAFKFNPFSGTLDQTGSGGGASYIDGEVQNFSALPETIGTPAVDSAYLVREAEGTWLLARKPAGIYIRTADTGVRAADWTHASAFPDVFSDAAFTVYSDGDSTKNLQLSLSGLTTGTTRTLTAPDASGTIALTSDFAAPPAIGSTTPNTGAFTTLSANNGVESNQRFSTAGSSLQLRQSSTTYQIYQGFFGPTNNAHGFALGANQDLTLLRDAADTLAQRRTTNPQVFRIYNTYTDASNHERLSLRWASNVAIIGTEKGSVGGSARVVEFHYDGTAALRLISDGVNIRQGNYYGFASSGIAAVDVAFQRASAGVIRIIDNGTNNPPALRIQNANNSTEYAALRWASNEFIFDANAGSGTLRGIKIGSASTSLLGFFGATPVVQQAAVADATDAATAITQLNDLLARLRTLGLIAT
jgi:hypothetical protein